MAKMIAEYPWENTSIGALSAWPSHLRTAVNLMLGAGAPMALIWGAEFHFIYNDRYAEIIQDKHPAALGSAGIRIFPEIWDALLPLFSQAFGGQAALIEDFELMVNRDGAAKPAYFSFSYNPIRNDHDRVDGFLAVVVETTARVVREQARSHVFDTVLSAIIDFAYTFDADGRFVYVNKALLNLWGLKLEDAVGKNFFDLKYPDDLAGRLQAQIQQVFSTRQVVRDETRYVSPTGVEGFYEYIFSPVFAADGSVTLVAGSTRDITSRKKLEIAALAASQAKDSFLAALSHELRTPLTPALVTVTALLEDRRLPEDVRAQLIMIERNIALEARLIDDLLDLTAISRGKLNLQLQPCDVHSLIGLAIEIVRLEASAKEIMLQRKFTAKRSALLADPARIQQVIWNLLRNAVKFTPAGGAISIETSEATQADGEWLRIEIADNGIGIEPTVIDRIFNPFDQGGFSGSHRFGGLGLGLSIARAVVQLHGGRISARSEGPGRGATFLVELPGPRLPATGVIHPPAARSSDTAAKPAVARRLLLVEDHEPTLQAISLLLRREGHFVVASRDVAGALAAAANGRFDLVISDLGLPDGTGIQLMDRLRADYGLRGIALSGYGMEGDITRSREAGFLFHLVKPVALAELRRVLDLALSG